MVGTTQGEDAAAGAEGLGTMQSVVQDRFGAVPADVLRVAEIDRPAPGKGAVRVRVRAASVDRGTWHLMAGMPYLIRLVGFGFSRPKHPNPGLAFAGTVDAVGPDVTGITPGDDVYGTGHGSFAEHVLAPADQVASMPANVTPAEAAAMPVSAVSALQAVRDAAAVEAGERVLVIGASGGVGTFAVQIAKAAGAEVTGVCGSASVDRVRALGADEVIDHTRDDFADGARRYDVIIDTGGHAGLRRLRRALAPRGRLVIVGSETSGRFLGGFGRQLRALLLSPFVKQKLGMLTSTENADDLDALRSLVESGAVTASIDRTFPLDETAPAVQRMLDGPARGKIVVEVA